MKHFKKLIILLSVLVLTLSLGIFAACGGNGGGGEGEGGGEEHTAHVDQNHDGICDICKEEIVPGGGNSTPLLNDLEGNGTLLDAYKATEGRYRYTFSTKSSSKVVYVNFHAAEEGVYSISSVGDVDVAVTRVYGSQQGGYYPVQNPTAMDHNKDISADDYNFYLEFNYTDIVLIDGEYLSLGSVVTFEIMLEETSQKGQEFTIIFEYEREVEPEPDPEYVSVQARSIRENPYPDEEGETQIKDALDAVNEMGFSYISAIVGEDGYYHWDSVSGPILMVKVAVAFPKWGMDQDFWELANPVDPITGVSSAKPENVSMFEKNTNGYFYYDYYNFVKAYHDAANSDGLYPANEELVTFLKRYVAKPEVSAWVTQPEYAGRLPQGYEWLWACCFYDVDNTPTLIGEGTAANSYKLNIMTDPNKGQYYKFNITAARGTVYFSYGQMTRLTISTSTEGVVGICDGQRFGEDGNGFTFTTGVNGLDETGTFQMYLLPGYPSVEVRFTATQEEDGSDEVPYSLLLNTEYTGTLLNTGRVYYTIVVSETQTYIMRFPQGAEHITLYYIYRPDYITYNQGGPFFPGEDGPEEAILFENLEPGTYVFWISGYRNNNTGRLDYAFTMSLYFNEFVAGEGTEGTPYVAGEGNYRITTGEDPVYVKFMPTEAGNYTITIPNTDATMLYLGLVPVDADESGLYYRFTVREADLANGILMVFDSLSGTPGVQMTITISKV